eukprot:gene11503-55362_t
MLTRPLPPLPALTGAWAGSGTDPRIATAAWRAARQIPDVFAGGGTTMSWQAFLLQVGIFGAGVSFQGAITPMVARRPPAGFQLRRSWDAGWAHVGAFNNVVRAAPAGSGLAALAVELDRITRRDPGSGLVRWAVAGWGGEGWRRRSARPA